MIVLFDAAEEDLSTNGVQILDPLIISGTAVMHGVLNGEHSLELELLPTARVRPEMLIKAPAPARDTPEISGGGGGGGGSGKTYDIYRVTGGTVRLRSGPGTKYKTLSTHRRNTEMVLVQKTNRYWYRVTAPNGNTGYMSTSYLEYVRTETEGGGGSGETIEPHKAKDQVFRVVEVICTLESVHVRAVHWAYDLRRNYVHHAATKGQTGAAALQLIAAGTAVEHDFAFYSDMGGKVEGDFDGTNPIEALLGDGGLVEQLGGEVLMDNGEIYWTDRIGEDRGVTIAYRKNMLGMEVDVNTEDVVTRIIPVGYDRDGNEILVSGTYVDSPIIGDYPLPCCRRIEYSDVKIGDEYADAAAVRAEILRRAQAEYSEQHADKPQAEIKVEYVDLKNTDVGERFEHYTNVYLGDTVRLRHEDYGFDIECEMTEYDWDPVLEEYIEGKFENKPARLGEIWKE